MRGWYRWDVGDLVIRVKAQPRSSRDCFAGLYGDRLRIRITAPPVDGKANAHLTAWLATQFDVPKADVVIESGEGSPLKTVRIRAPRILPKGLNVADKK